MKKKRHWTIEEDKLLKRYYPDHPTTELASLFNRPIKAIYNRTAKLGLTKTDEFIRSLNTRISHSRQYNRAI